MYIRLAQESDSWKEGFDSSKDLTPIDLERVREGWGAVGDIPCVGAVLLFESF